MKLISQLSKREKNIFYFTILIIAFSLIFKFILLPLFNLNQRLTQEVKAKEIELVRARRLSKGGSVQSQYDAFIAAIKMGESQDLEMARLLSEIESIAKEAGVNILNLRPHEIEDKRFYKRFLIELKSEGTSQQILRFIFSLESSQLLLRIEKFNLSSRISKGNLLNATLTVSRVAIP
ncbi:MAG: type 4a pilus biogenesis protein PilO [Candidatus Omnitrophica bacterium]|nr:type 4a pilus biogenesis protein PilO [Candidatus Omnitrophota bacterium]